VENRFVVAVVSGLAAGALSVVGAAAAHAEPPAPADPPAADPPAPPCVPGVPGLPPGAGVVVDATTRPAPITDLG
jgi:hypothetical protein